MKTNSAGFLSRRKEAFSEQTWQQQVAEQDASLLYAPHFDGKRYYNPWFRAQRNWRDMLAYFLDKAPGSPLPSINTSLLPYDYSYLADRRSPDSLTWLGHASLALMACGQLVLLDPFLSERAFTVKRALPAAVDVNNLPQDCLIVISHNHYDHLDKATISRLAGASFICPLGVGGLLYKWGARKIRELDWWQHASWRDIRIICLPAHHWSQRLEQPANRSLWASYLLQFNDKQVYFGGDSAYFVGYREMGARFAGIDIAVLPCGAYAPRWFMHQAHMDVNEMLKAFQELGANFLLPMHWGSIALGHEPLNEPGRLLTRYVQLNPELRKKILSINGGQPLLLKDLTCPTVV